MPYNFAADSFHTKKLCSRLSSSEVRLQRKNGRFACLSPPLGELGATQDDHLRLIGKRVGDFLLVLTHPGAEAREPQKTFVGRQLDVPLYRSSYRFRLASWCEPFRRGANSLMDREFGVHCECVTKHVHGAAAYLTRQIIFLNVALMQYPYRIINVAFIVQWPITVVLNSYIQHYALFDVWLHNNTHFNILIYARERRFVQNWPQHHYRYHH